MLDIKMLKDMPSGTVFATGKAVDSSEGINMLSTGKILRWVAVRGGIHDWAIYCHYADKSIEWIRDHGDKVHDMETVQRLVACDYASLQIYRH